MRRAPLLLSAALWLSPTVAAASQAAVSEADGPTFPRPAELREAIDFWKLVFGRYSTGHALVHDSEDLSLVYGVELLPPTTDPKQRRRIQEAILARYRQAIERLAEGPADTSQLSEVERRVRLVLGESADPLRYRARVETLRVQVGQRDRIVQGLGEWDRHGDRIRQVLRQHGVPDSLAVLPFIESGYNPRAHSKVGAAGLWQIMPSTGRPYLRIGRRVDERLDPLKASVAAAKILRGNHQALGNWPLAITAYNHGPAGVARGVQEVGSQDIVDLAQRYRGRAFGFASRNFYAEFVAVLELIQERHTYYGPQAPPAGELSAPWLAVGFTPGSVPVPAAPEPALPKVSLAQGLQVLARQVRSFTTVDAAALPPEHVAAIGDAIEVPPDAGLRSFRWGPSLAPPGHALHGTFWYTVWFARAEGPTPETFWLTPDGQLLDTTRSQ